MNIQHTDKPDSTAPHEDPRGTVLVIGMASSIHVVRWAAMVAAFTQLRFVLCPVFRTVPHLAARGYEFLNPIRTSPTGT